MLIFSFIFFLFILNNDTFVNANSYGYGGVKNNIASLLLFIIFYLIPIKDNSSDIFIKIIYQITNYTQGIYSQHFIIKKVFESKISSIKNRRFLGTILIYFFCYLISFIGEKVTKKTKLSQFEI